VRNGTYVEHCRVKIINLCWPYAGHVTQYGYGTCIPQCSLMYIKKLMVTLHMQD